MNLLEWIVEAAKVASFSSYEERLHPLVKSAVNKCPGAILEIVADNNLMVTVPGKKVGEAIAVTAHLDKINHFGVDRTDELSVVRENGKLTGLMDDATGVGTLLYLIQECSKMDTPPLYFLFSELEEGTGLKQAPNLLKNNGEGYSHGMGARRLAAYLVKTKRLPRVVITVDTTPFFKGERGVALYSRHWEFNGLTPTTELIEKTAMIEEWFGKVYPDVVHRNNTNDYLEYGKILNEGTGRAVPSIAIEPAIFPYHCADEGVFESDIERVAEIVTSMLYL